MNLFPVAPEPPLDRPVVSFRADQKGGGSRLNPRFNVPIRPLRHYIIFVHGFNVTEGEAYDSYEQFEKNLRALASPALLERFIPNVLWLIWPGDTRLFALMPPVHSVARRAIYGPRVQDVMRTATYVACWLLRLRGPGDGPCSLEFVGHSLGCRLILEALLPFTQYGQGDDANHVDSLMLMAAAVPVTHVERDGRLWPAVGLAGEIDVLHSSADLVLKAAFRAGQTAGELSAGIWQEAIGYRGLPGRPPWASSKSMWLRHGEYWASRAVALRFLHRHRILSPAGPQPFGGAASHTVGERPSIVDYRRPTWRQGPDDRLGPGWMRFR